MSSGERIAAQVDLVVDKIADRRMFGRYEIDERNSVKSCYSGESRRQGAFDSKV